VRLIRGLRNAVAFLTVLPVGTDREGLYQAANYMPVFPLIGAFIGFVCGSFVWALELFLPTLMAGILGLGLLLLFTGVHHTDGLLDLGDAVMAHGSREKRLRVMRDARTGAGGFSLGFIVLAATAVGIAAINRGTVVQALIASEAGAKFAMVFQAVMGKPAHRGMSTPFVKAMHERWRWIRFGLAFGLQFAICVAVLQIVGLVLAVSAVAVAAAMLAISTRILGGVTGDVMGATNDLTRLVSLLIIMVGAR